VNANLPQFEQDVRQMRSQGMQTSIRTLDAESLRGGLAVLGDSARKPLLTVAASETGALISRASPGCEA